MRSTAPRHSVAVDVSPVEEVEEAVLSADDQDAVPKTRWDFSLWAKVVGSEREFPLAFFRHYSTIHLLAWRIELSRDGARAPLQVPEWEAALTAAP